MKLQVTILACALALSGCADRAARDRLGIEDDTVLKTGVAASQDEAAGAANSQWIDAYASIVSSEVALAALQQRLNQLSSNKNDYFHAKAQCWIDAGEQARQLGDHWGFVEEAIGQVALITMSLEKGIPVSAANPALRTVSTVRPDLWKIVNTIKSDPAIAACPEAQRPLACAEVELMQAGHDAWKRSFSAAEKRLPEIQDNLRKAAETALQCKQIKAQTQPVSTTPAPRKITLRADSLFRFGGGDESSILASGKPLLENLATGLRQVPAVNELEITGYTDRLGSDAYNQTLSLQRAQTVKAYLAAHGVTLPIRAQGHGNSNPPSVCQQKKRAELVRCLAPDRRVEIEFVLGSH